jgi:hypothetical protein
MNFNTRIEQIAQLYELLSSLELRTLNECAGKLSWPNRGVYFFFDPNQKRSDTGNGSRLIRIGTHALKAGSKTTLWQRLSQHKGSAKSGGGNHRGSIFRLLVGDAIIRSREIDCLTWGKGSTASRDIRLAEQYMEQEVSQYIGGLPFACVSIPNDAGPNSLRGTIERNCISLLSNSMNESVDSLDDKWLRRNSSREKVTQSELWNQNHINEQADPMFLEKLAQLIESKQ